MIQACHGASRAIDGQNFATRFNFNLKAIAKELWRGHQQLFTIRNLPADMVRQTAIGKRYRWPFLNERDLSRGITPPSPCSGSRPSGHTTHNHNSQLIRPVHIRSIPSQGPCHNPRRAHYDDKLTWEETKARRVWRCCAIAAQSKPDASARGKREGSFVLLIQSFGGRLCRPSVRCLRRRVKQNSPACRLGDYALLRVDGGGFFLRWSNGFEILANRFAMT